MFVDGKTKPPLPLLSAQARGLQVVSPELQVAVAVWEKLLTASLPAFPHLFTFSLSYFILLYSTLLCYCLVSAF